MGQSRELSPYRWVIEGLLILALLSQTLVWLAPAAILPPIAKDLGISLKSGGLIISVIALFIALFSFGGALIVENIGVLRTMLFGVWLMAVGAVLSGYVAGFGALLGCRVVEGLGFGLMIAPTGALVVEWFGEKEWPYINTVNYACSYAGIAVAFGLTTSLYSRLQSWHSAMLVYGGAVAIVALAWTVFGRESSRVGADDELSTDAPPAEAGGAPLGEVFGMRPVILVALAFSFAMWVFQLYTAFMPSFFVAYRGMTLEEAGRVTSILPIAGIFGAFGGGMLTTITGLRKPFLWPVMTLMLLGCVGSVLSPNAALLSISLVAFGVGASAHLGAMATLVMELPDMTPARVGAALALVFGMGYAFAFLSPVVGGALADRFGLEAVLLGTLVLQPVAIVSFLMVPETGPGRVASAPAIAPGA
jgi:cyanate permease